MYPILLFSLLLWTNSVQAALNVSEAMAECGNLHQLQFHNILNAEAEFSNEHCALKCSIAGKVLSDDALNEGFHCPKNLNGICHSGKCITTPVSPPSDALRECANIHHLDFLNQNSTGSEYSESQCSLKCVLQSSTISTNSINEGFPCPDNHNGICRNGHCLADSKSTVPTTTAFPSTTNRLSSPSSVSQVYKVDELDLKFQYAHLFNGSHFKFHATACLEVTTHALSCKQSCTSKGILLMTDRPVWSENCPHWKGPFEGKQDSLVIRVFYEGSDNKEHELGGFKEPVHSLLDRHYHSQFTFTERDVKPTFAKEEKFAILNANNETLGEIVLAFSYRISHKQTD